MPRSCSIRQLIGRSAVVALVTFAAGCARESEPKLPATTIGIEAHPGARDLHEFAEAQRRARKLPALAVGIIREGRVIGLGVAGEVKLGSGERATLEHRFDIGSCAKSFTATVAARLVEQGAIRWDTTIGETLSALDPAVHPDFRRVTLDLLLRHRSGLGQTMNRDILWQAWHRDHAGATATEQRRLLAASVLSQAPRSVPDTEEFYTNDAYLVAAAMMEQAAGQPWEQSVMDLVLQPSGLTTVTFGPPTAADVPVMWGHHDQSLGRTRTIAPDATLYGEPPFGSPGGFMYCTLTDLLRWVDIHIAGENGQGTLLRRESFARLHSTMSDRGFGLGWEVEVQRDAAGRMVERSIYHGGNTAGFRANMWFCPESKTGTVILYNHAGEAHTDDYVGIFYALLREFKLGPEMPR